MTVNLKLYTGLFGDLGVHVEKSFCSMASCCFGLVVVFGYSRFGQKADQLCCDYFFWFNGLEATNVLDSLARTKKYYI